MLDRRQLLGAACSAALLPSTAVAGEGPDFSSLHGFCDGVAPEDESERLSRRERARTLLQQADLDALVCEAGVAQHWLTGTRWGTSERPLLYVLPVDGEPLWVGPSFETATLTERVSHGGLLPWQEDESPAVVLAARLGAQARLALDPELRLFVADALRERMPAASSGTALFRALRVVKTPSELTRLERASRATKAALAAVAPHLRVGHSPDQIKQWVCSAQQAAGLTDVWALALVGPQASYPHGTENPGPLGSGEALLVDTGGSLHGYRSDVSRTWVPQGKPTRPLREAWEAVRAAQDAALEAVRPGAVAATIDAAARAVITQRGFGDGFTDFTHRLGHGIGVEVHEPPYLVGSNMLPLEAGMAFSDEPGIYRPGAFGVRLEDIVVVTVDGARVLGARDNTLRHPGTADG